MDVPHSLTASIKYHNENSILGQVNDPEKTYIEQIMPDKIRLNLEYAARSSLWTDFKIILRTFLRLFIWRMHR